MSNRGRLPVAADRRAVVQTAKRADLKGDISLEVDSRDGLRWCGGIRGLLASCSERPWKSSDE